MNDRIRQFMDYKHLTSSELADSIGIQRSNLTHVLNGRNKPSFPFISKLLETYPEINAKWLLLGQGEMLENSAAVSPEANLFSTFQKNTIPPEKEQKQAISIKEEEPVRYPNKAIPVIPNDIDTKEVERIVVFYTNQTFKSYTPSK